jgi:hypothetical protein
MENVRVYGVSEAQLSKWETANQESLDLQRLLVSTILLYVRAPTFTRRAELRAAADQALPLLEARETAFRDFMAELRADTLADQ